MASFSINYSYVCLIRIIVSFAIIYSSSFIALSEQSHELAYAGLGSDQGGFFRDYL